MRITTHILDLAAGRPAAGVGVTLEFAERGAWAKVGQGVTSSDGRLTALDAGAPLATGTYRLSFATGPYLDGRGVPAFYPEVAIVFVVRDGREHHHVPLLLSPFGYSTYRGS